MNIIQKSYKHFCIITKHKLEVAKSCFKSGLYWQGITHDLSKYTLSEFVEYAQYYNGTISPVDKAKEIKGYCNAWMHHKGHNPHHYEYWIDYLDRGGIPIMMPYKYAMEMVCDYIGAGKTYEKSAWTTESPLTYWNNKKQTAKIHDKTKLFLDQVFENYFYDGDSSLEKRKTLELYQTILNKKEQ